MKKLLITLCLGFCSFNLGLALEEYSLPNPAEQFEADFYNLLLGKEDKVKTPLSLTPWAPPSPVEIAFKRAIEESTYTPTSASKNLAKLMLEEKEQRLEEKEQIIQYFK